MQIGRRNNRSLQTPSNQGMARRVDKRLDATANAQAARFEQALAVDGSVAIIWNTQKGTEVCTCRGTNDTFSEGSLLQDGTPNYSPEQVSSSVNEETGSVTTAVAANVGSGASLGDSDYSYVGNSLNTDNLDSYFSDKFAFETNPDKINADAEDLNEEQFDGDDEDYEGNDFMSAFELDGQEGVSANRDDDNNPLVNALSEDSTLSDSDDLLTPSTVSCPICLGRGYVDTLGIYNGQRTILHVGSPNIDIEGAEIIEDQPLRLRHYSGTRSSVTWAGVIIPPMWKHLIRITLFDMGRIVTADRAKVSYIHSSAPDTKVPLTHESLTALKNSGNLNLDHRIDIVVEGIKDGVDFTHFEILYSIGNIVKIQVPEIEVPRQEEFIDWNLNVTFEMSPSITIRENSYVVEGKYNRIWKVSSLTRKVTAGGKGYAYQVNARALHLYERAAAVLRVLGEAIDPFSDTLDDDIDDEL